MKRTSARLADGREIIYFDEADDAVRVLHDPRTLPVTATASEVRYDAVLDEWVGIASHRQDRTHLPPTHECPLCPSTPERATEIPTYDVVVFENRFPSFAQSVPEVPDTVDAGGSLFRRQRGVGRCEVVCFTSDHNSSFGQLSPERVRLVVEAWVDRTMELSRLPHVEQVFCFENRGREIGVTLPHPTARSTPTRSSHRAPGECSTLPAATASGPGGTCSPTCWRRSAAEKYGL